MTNKKLILFLAFFTLVGFPALGYLIFYFFGEGELIDVLDGDMSLFLQILIGFSIGWLAAELAAKLIAATFMKPVLSKYSNLFADLHFNLFDIIFISICAGVGEELLFRGALQPLWGIWLTSVAFVALHGYLNPFDWRISIYGLYLTVVIIGLGFMCKYWGIWSAVAAHTAIDIVLLRFLSIKPLFKETNLEE